MKQLAKKMGYERQNDKPSYCPFYKEGFGCTIYEQRPEICRQTFCIFNEGERTFCGQLENYRIAARQRIVNGEMSPGTKFQDTFKP